VLSQTPLLHGGEWGVPPPQETNPSLGLRPKFSCWAFGPHSAAYTQQSLFPPMFRGLDKTLCGARICDPATSLRRIVVARQSSRSCNHFLRD